MKILARTSALFIFAWIMLSVFNAYGAESQRLNIFAWLENDQILVQATFGKDHPASSAVVTIMDSTNNHELLSGRTNTAGRFVFIVPQIVRQGHGLLIDVNAGDGHHSEWSMDASELYAAASLTAGFDEAALEARQEQKNFPVRQAPEVTNTAPSVAPQQSYVAPVQTTEPAQTAAEEPPVPTVERPLTADQTRSIVHEAIETHVAPIRKALEEKTYSSPSIMEIIGGIGWIVGLIGIILYFMSRRKQE